MQSLKNAEMQKKITELRVFHAINLPSSVEFVNYHGIICITKFEQISYVYQHLQHH